jgi:hypothetical protein
LTGPEAAAQVAAKKLKLTVPPETNNVPALVIAVMDQCLQYAAEDRPDFSVITQQLQDLE